MIRPLHMFHIRATVRQELVNQGYTEEQIDSVMPNCDRHAVEAASETANVALSNAPGYNKVGAAFDGSLIKAFIEWLKGPQGQQLMAALVQMLIALIAGIK